MNWEELVEEIKRLDEASKLRLSSLVSYGKMGGELVVDNKVVQIMYEAGGRISVKYEGNPDEEWVTIAWDVTADGFLQMLRILGYLKE